MTAFARNEVIVSAGAIASPQLLMLSGIGPATTLGKHGIPLVKNMPGVGQNLQSHVGTGELIFTVDKPVSFNPVRLVPNPVNWINYFLNGDGPLAISGFERKCSAVFGFFLNVRVHFGFRVHFSFS